MAELILENKKILADVAQLLDADKALYNSLRSLIRDSSYEFDPMHSSRMLLYYDEKGYLTSTRIGEKGKRRFSLYDKLSLNFNLYLKTIGIADDKLIRTQATLHDLNENNSSLFDTCVIISGILLGVESLGITPKIIESDNIINSFVLHPHKSHSFDISIWLKHCFFDDNRTIILKKKSCSFLPIFIYYIDSVRVKLGIPLVSPIHFENVVTFGIDQAVKMFDESEADRLSQMPFSMLAYSYDILYNNNNNWFGINVEYLTYSEDYPEKNRGIIIKSEDEIQNAVSSLVRKIEDVKTKYDIKFRK